MVVCSDMRSLFSGIGHFAQMWRVGRLITLPSFGRSLSGKCTPSTGTITITFDDGKSSSFHNIWLRDNCLCPQCIDRPSKQKLQSVFPKLTKIHTGNHQLSTPSPSEVKVVWDFDQHESVYPVSWLKRYDYTQKVQPLRTIPAQQSWGSELTQKLPEVQYDQVMSGEKKNLLEWLHKLHVFGFCMVRGAPVEKNIVEKMANKIHYIRRSIYGDVWDVVSVPNAENVAYTSMEIPFHQDLLYYEAPPGLQFLHCLRYDAQVKGGDSTVCDGVKIGEVIQKRDPDAFRLLTTVPISFHYLTGENRLRQRRTPLVVQEGKVVGINYSPPWEAPMQIAPELVVPMYNALRILHETLADKQYWVRFTLKPGDVMTFDNRRLLHARDQYYEPKPGMRHLQGTYVDTDEFLSVYERLLESQSSTSA